MEENAVFLKHSVCKGIYWLVVCCSGIYILAISPQIVQIENREEFEGGLHEKGREKKRVIKHTLKYLYEA